MVVFNRHVMSVAMIPPETDSPLVVHSDAVFFAPFARKFLEVVTWWEAYVIDRRGRGYSGRMDTGLGSGKP